MAVSVLEDNSVESVHTSSIPGDENGTLGDKPSKSPPRPCGAPSAGSALQAQEEARPAAPKVPDEILARQTSDLSEGLLELSGTPALDGKAWRRWGLAVKFLLRCEYPLEDVCSMLAHASAYFGDLYAEVGSTMKADEASHVMVAFLYIAHSYVADECVFLRHWQRILCSARYSVRVLDSVILRLLKRRGYSLRLGEDEFRRRYWALRCAADGLLT